MRGGHGWVHVCAHVWRPEGNLGNHPLGTIYLLFETICFTGLRLGVMLGRLASNPQAFPCPFLSRAGLRAHPAMLSFYVGLGESTQVLMLANQELCRMTYLPSPAVLTTGVVSLRCITWGYKAHTESEMITLMEQILYFIFLTEGTEQQTQLFINFPFRNQHSKTL